MNQFRFVVARFTGGTFSNTQLKVKQTFFPLLSLLLLTHTHIIGRGLARFAIFNCLTKHISDLRLTFTGNCLHSEIIEIYKSLQQQQPAAGRQQQVMNNI